MSAAGADDGTLMGTVPPRHPYPAAYCSRLGRDTVARRVQPFIKAGLVERRKVGYTASRADG